MELDTNDALKNLQSSLSMVEQISEKDKKKIDLLMDESKIVKNSNLHIDPCILTRIDQIDIELAKLRSMRQQEDSKRDTLNKMAKRFHDQISEINDNYDTMMDIQDKLTKPFDECDKRKQFDTSKRYHDQISEINDNYDTMMDIQDKLTKSFDECDKMKRFDASNEETDSQNT